MMHHRSTQTDLTSLLCDQYCGICASDLHTASSGWGEVEVSLFFRCPYQLAAVTEPMYPLEFWSNVY